MEEKVKIVHEHFEDGSNTTEISGGDQADAIFALLMALLPEDIYELTTVGVDSGEQDFSAA